MINKSVKNVLSQNNVKSLKVTEHPKPVANVFNVIHILREKTTTLSVKTVTYQTVKLLTWIGQMELIVTVKLVNLHTFYKKMELASCVK